MKFRLDFVTNSSSSSYVCEICGNTESGFDLSAYEVGMCECVNNHVMCREHLLEVDREELKKVIMNKEYYDRDLGGYFKFNKSDLGDKLDEELEELACGEYWDDVPECMCPICQFQEYSSFDMASYLLKEYHVPKDVVFEEIKKENKRRRKLYDHEYIAYVVKKFNLDLGEIQASWKNRFNSYHDFWNYIRSA